MGKRQRSRERSGRSSSSSSKHRSTSRKHHHRRRSRSRSRNRSAGSPSPPAGTTLAKQRAKLLKYAVRGDARKARRLLSRERTAAAALLSVTAAGDGGGGAAAGATTPLHAAAKRGHADLVSLLVRYGADAGARDALGNSPAHLAVQGGHMPLLVTLLQADRPPDIDAPNAAGVTVRQLSQAAMHAEDAAAARRQRQGTGGTSDDAHDADDADDADEEAWRKRLQEEMSDDEAGGIGYARYRPAAHGGGDDDVFVWPTGLDEGDDDSWADRVWEDMKRQQRLRRAVEQREQGFGDAVAARAAAEAERRRRAAAAAEASARILAEERAKEANWREGMLKQVAEVRLCMLLSIGCGFTAGWWSLTHPQIRTPTHHLNPIRRQRCQHSAASTNQPGCAWTLPSALLVVLPSRLPTSLGQPERCKRSHTAAAAVRVV